MPIVLKLYERGLGDIQDHPHACVDGYVYIGHVVEGEDGEETQQIERLPCRRCAEPKGDARA